MSRPMRLKYPRAAVAPRPATNWAEASALIVLALLIYLFWNTPVIYPLRILVVFFHELSHAIAAWLTRGSVAEIRVNEFEGGLTMTRGGSRLLILNAGYLGSLVWGGWMLVASAKSHKHSPHTIMLGILVLVVTLWLVRPVASFGFWFGIMMSLCLIITGVQLSQRVNEYVLKVLGLTTCLYAVLDILADTVIRPELPSDAAMLADYTGAPTLFWGILWLAVSIAGTLYFLRTACERS